jgi:hypothetical protein
MTPLSEGSGGRHQRQQWRSSPRTKDNRCDAVVWRSLGAAGKPAGRVRAQCGRRAVDDGLCRQHFNMRDRVNRWSAKAAEDAADAAAFVKMISESRQTGFEPDLCARGPPHPPSGTFAEINGGDDQIVIRGQWGSAPKGDSRDHGEPPDEPPASEAARGRIGFQSPVWYLGNVLAWIAFRDPARLCRFESGWIGQRFLGSRQRLLASGLRTSGKRRVVDRPDWALLAALQNGDVTVTRDSAKLSRLYWFDKDVRHLTDDLRFLRAKVLARWPAISNDKMGEGQPKAASGSKGTARRARVSNRSRRAPQTK